MFEYDYFLSVHFYTNASKYACDLIIIQFQFQKKKKMIEISVQYDFIIFISTEMRYSIYKRKLCVLTKFVIKYDYFCKHSKIIVIIHIDHKSLIQFLKSDSHENIYDHWTDKLRRLNLKIQYISERRNRVTDELFRILFLTENCTTDSNVIKTWRVISKKNSKWIWKNDKKNYQVFLNFFNDSNKIEIILSEILQRKNVFFQFLSMKIIIDSNCDSWEKAYLASKWFADIYRVHITNQSFSSSNVFFKIMNFRIDLHIKVLWKHHQDLFFSCISEFKILKILKQTHDENDHWIKQKTIAKFRKAIYWFFQSTDVKRYIKNCISCVRHKLIQRSQLLQSIRIHDFFQFMNFDFIEFLFKTRIGSIHIFHVMNYFFRFSMTFFFEIATAENVVLFLNQIFVRYTRLLDIYCDRNHHFQNTLVKNYFFQLKIIFIFSSSGAFQSTKMIEIENKLLKNILKKTVDDRNWKQIFFKTTYDFNARIIHHLKVSSVFILFEIFSNVSITNITLKQSVEINLIHEWINLILNSYSHKKLFQNFHEHRNQLHDRVRMKSNQQKNAKITKFNRKIQFRKFASENLVFFYQKNIEKLKSKWKNSFRIENYDDTHEISYEIRQLNEKRIKRTFHENHLKKFVFRTEHFSFFDYHQFSNQQTIRNRKNKQSRIKT